MCHLVALSERSMKEPSLMEFPNREEYRVRFQNCGKNILKASNLTCLRHLNFISKESSKAIWERCLTWPGIFSSLDQRGRLDQIDLTKSHWNGNPSINYEKKGRVTVFSSSLLLMALPVRASCIYSTSQALGDALLLLLLSHFSRVRLCATP